MSGDIKIYTQDEVDDLRRQWETAAFELKTKEVLTNINRRLDESNNYKATIGRDVRQAIENQRDIMARIEAIEEARQADMIQAKEDVQNKREWWRDKWIRAGIGFAIIYEFLQIGHLLGWF